MAEDAEDAFPGPGSITWRHIGQWRFLLVLGLTLALQIAHPVVGAGVAEHSTYRAHPWRRAEHTLDSLQRLCYADPAARAKEIKRIARQHHRISGVDVRNRPTAPPTRRRVPGTPSCRRSRKQSSSPASARGGSNCAAAPASPGREASRGTRSSG